MKPDDFKRIQDQAKLQFDGMRRAGECLHSKEETAKARKRLKDAGFDVEKWAAVLMGGDFGREGRET